MGLVLGVTHFAGLGRSPRADASAHSDMNSPMVYFA